MTVPATRSLIRGVSPARSCTDLASCARSWTFDDAVRRRSPGGGAPARPYRRHRYRHTDRRPSRPSTGGASTLRRDAGRRRSRQSCRTAVLRSGQLKNNRITIEYLPARRPSRIGVTGWSSWRPAPNDPAVSRCVGVNMTGTGRFIRQTARMDLIELARTYQVDRTREIEASTRRRRLLLGTATRAVPTTTNSTPRSPQAGAGAQSVVPSPSTR